MAGEVPKPGSEAGFLSGFSTFRDFSHGDLRKVVRASSRVSLPTSWPVIHEQTPGDACYILLSGTVAIFAGRERIAELGPGEVVGEVALRTGRLRTATVSTLEPVELLRIEGSRLDTLLRELPVLRHAIDNTAAAHGAD